MPLRSLITRAADELHDAVLRQTINLLRVAAGQSRTALGLLEKLENKLVGDLNNMLGKNPRAGKLRALLSETQASIGDVYATIAETHTAQLGEIAGATMADMERVEARILRVPITRAEPTAAELEKLANKTLIQGRYAKEWWGQQGTATQDRLAVRMREGLLKGETIDELARRVRGTKAAGYADSVLRQSRTNAEAIIRTSAITVGNAARMKGISTSPMTRGLVWISVLDSRTTLICIGLSGKMWTLPELEPIGHTKPFPGPTAHVGCRSSQAPVTLSWEDLRATQVRSEGRRGPYEAILRGKFAHEGRSDAEITAAVERQRQRFAGSGVPESATLEDWLSRHTDAELDEMLGPGRAKLFREGRITASQLTDQRNRPLTLDQLKKIAFGAK